MWMNRNQEESMNKKKVAISGFKNSGHSVHEMLQAFDDYEVCAFTDNVINMYGSKLYEIEIMGNEELLRYINIWKEKWKNENFFVGHWENFRRDHQKLYIPKGI